MYDFVIQPGIGNNIESVSHVKELLEQHLSGIYVHSAEIGNGKEDSIIWPMNRQVRITSICGLSHRQIDYFCHSLASDPKLKDGFNLIGFSQGGLISRGFIERCNYPKVKNFISWVSPQAGKS